MPSNYPKFSCFFLTNNDNFTFDHIQSFPNLTTWSNQIPTLYNLQLIRRRCRIIWSEFRAARWQRWQYCCVSRRPRLDQYPSPCLGMWSCSSGLSALSLRSWRRQWATPVRPCRRRLTARGRRSRSTWTCLVSRTTCHSCAAGTCLSAAKKKSGIRI